MIGAILRLFMTSLAVAGEIVSIQTTLSFSQTANPMQAQPGESLGAFLALMGASLIFTTDLHHLFLEAIVHSYDLFSLRPPGADRRRRPSSRCRRSASPSRSASSSPRR